MEASGGARSDLATAEGHLLSAADLEPPLSKDEAGSAETYLTLAGVEPSTVAIEAIGYYARREITRRINSTTLDAGEFIDQLPGTIQESDLLKRLVTEYADLRDDQTHEPGLGKRITQAARLKRLLPAPRLPSAVAVKADSNDLASRNQASTDTAEARRNKKIDKIASRIAKRTVKKIGRGDFPFTVKGGLTGRHASMYDSAIYAAVSKKLAKKGATIKVYRVHSRKGWDHRNPDPTAIADVMTVQGVNTFLQGKLKPGHEDPFTDPSGYRANQHLGGYGKDYVVREVYPGVLWG